MLWWAQAKAQQKHETLQEKNCKSFALLPSCRAQYGTAECTDQFFTDFLCLLISCLQKQIKKIQQDVGCGWVFSDSFLQKISVSDRSKGQSFRLCLTLTTNKQKRILHNVLMLKGEQSWNSREGNATCMPPTISYHLRKSNSREKTGKFLTKWLKLTHLDLYVKSYMYTLLAAFLILGDSLDCRYLGSNQLQYSLPDLFSTKQ